MQHTREAGKVLVQVSFDRAQYYPGDEVAITVDWQPEPPLASAPPGADGRTGKVATPSSGERVHCRLEVRVFRLDREIGRLFHYFELEWGRPASAVFSWPIPRKELEKAGAEGRFVIGFGVEAEIWAAEDFFAELEDDFEHDEEANEGERDDGGQEGGGGSEHQIPAPLGRGQGAFDVASSWDVAPRYGFVTNFAGDEAVESEETRWAWRPDEEERWRQMKDLHLNVIQFYDWMYRHHQLLPPSDTFQDPLGRELSLESVKRQVFLAQLYGMKAFGYAAVYGAEQEFFAEEKNAGGRREFWRAYTRDGRAFGLGGFIFLMDVSGRTPWLNHFVSELETARSEIGFAGFHLDQYGYPKAYFLKGEPAALEGEVPASARRIDSAPAERVDTAKAFAGLIRAARERLGPEVGLIFNCVNNWPVELVAREPQDVIYIEVWPPHEHYRDLRRLILRARELASPQKKQVILAAYIAPLARVADENEAEAEETLFLTAAAIMANGGFHLVLGEGLSALTDAYYPRYQPLSLRAAAWVRAAWDFSVRYAELLYDFALADTSEYVAGGVNVDLRLNLGLAFGPMADANSVWTIVREKPGLKVLNLVNLVGVDDTRWNAPKKTPRPLDNLSLEWLVDGEVEAVFWAAPEVDGGKAQELAWRYVPHEHGEAVATVIPHLERWGLVWVRMKQLEEKNGGA